MSLERMPGKTNLYHTITEDELELRPEWGIQPDRRLSGDEGMYCFLSYLGP